MDFLASIHGEYARSYVYNRCWESRHIPRHEYVQNCKKNHNPTSILSEGELDTENYLRGVYFRIGYSNVLSDWFGRHLHYTVRPFGPNDGKWYANLIYISNTEQYRLLPAKAWHRFNTSTLFYLIIWKGHMMISRPGGRKRGCKKRKEQKNHNPASILSGGEQVTENLLMLGFCFRIGRGSNGATWLSFWLHVSALHRLDHFVLSTGCDVLKWYICQNFCISFVGLSLLVFGFCSIRDIYASVKCFLMLSFGWFIDGSLIGGAKMTKVRNTSSRTVGSCAVTTNLMMWFCLRLAWCLECAIWKMYVHYDVDKSEVAIWDTVIGFQKFEKAAGMRQTRKEPCPLW